MPDGQDDFVSWARAVEILSDRGAFSPAKAAGQLLQAVKTNDVRLRDRLGNVLRWEQTPEAEIERERHKEQQEAERAEDARREARRAEAKNAPRYDPLSRWRRH